MPAMGPLAGTATRTTSGVMRNWIRWLIWPVTLMYARVRLNPL